MRADEDDDAEKEAARASGDGEVEDKGVADEEAEEAEASGGNRLLEVELTLFDVRKLVAAEAAEEAEADRPGGRGRRRDLLSTFDVLTAWPRRRRVDRASCPRRLTVKRSGAGAGEKEVRCLEGRDAGSGEAPIRATHQPDMTMTWFNTLSQRTVHRGCTSA